MVNYGRLWDVHYIALRSSSEVVKDRKMGWLCDIQYVALTSEMDRNRGCATSTI